MSNICGAMSIFGDFLGDTLSEFDWPIDLKFVAVGPKQIEDYLLLVFGLVMKQPALSCRIHAILCDDLVLCIDWYQTCCNRAINETE